MRNSRSGAPSKLDADVLQILLEVPESERHGAILWQRAGRAIALHNFAAGRAAYGQLY
jgi:hypothetical protein